MQYTCCSPIHQGFLVQWVGKVYVNEVVARCPTRQGGHLPVQQARLGKQPPESPGRKKQARPSVIRLVPENEGSYPEVRQGKQEIDRCPIDGEDRDRDAQRVQRLDRGCGHADVETVSVEGVEPGHVGRGTGDVDY